MSQLIKISADRALKVKTNKSYRCKLSKSYPLFVSDVLTKESSGTYMKHNGLAIGGIQIPEEDLESYGRDVELVL